MTVKAVGQTVRFGFKESLSAWGWLLLVVNVSDGLHSFSKFQKCEKHGINMTAISEISKLSWRCV